jgi:hypothetical protein
MCCTDAPAPSYPGRCPASNFAPAQTPLPACYRFLGEGPSRRRSLDDSDGLKQDASLLDAPEGTPEVMIADNHVHLSHSMTVTAADVDAGVDKTYSIPGTAMHDHTVTITAAQFAQLKLKLAVMDTSTAIICHMHVCTTTDT